MARLEEMKELNLLTTHQTIRKCQVHQELRPIYEKKEAYWQQRSK
jgi:hypothetical protein